MTNPTDNPAALRSCVYECTVRHERFAPKRHRFGYRLFYLAIDLDELPALHRRLRLLSINRRNVFSLQDRDFLPSDAAGSLKDRLIDFCARQGVDLGPAPHVFLVTLPRVLGYQFNPVSLYFCHDSAGLPLCAVAEVTNTFREVKPFLLPATRSAGGRPAFRLRTSKHFYVSPFSRPDLDFDFVLASPGESLGVRIDVHDGAQRTLHATLAGRRRPLTDARLAWFAIKYPVVTLAVIGRIHWQAFRLWLKRVPHFAKAASPEHQRDLYRPHASLATARNSAAAPGAQSLSPS